MVTPDRELDAYLDALVSGAPAPPHALDRGTLLTVDRLFAADDVPELTAEDADHIWGEVLRGIAAAPTMASGPLHAVEPALGSTEAAARHAWRAGMRPRRWRPQPWAMACRPRP